ncbi:MAG: hypothetical protein F6K30_09025 [Cyanothece sp. SIO2G6]|nr:hypothetical protein [Cyanothece sp. SIO2G6]
MGKSHELIDPNHPLIRWIRDRYSTASQTLHPVSAISIHSESVSLDPGEYVYSIYLWDFEGVKVENQLVYKAIAVNDGVFLSDQSSESLVSIVMQQGQNRLNAHNFLDNVDLINQRQKQCNQYIENAFDQAIEYFIIDNENHCNIQEKSARTFAERKQSELSNRLDRFHREGKTQIIPAVEGQLNKVNRELDVKLRIVDHKRSQISFNQQQLASGIIFVTH